MIRFKQFLIENRVNTLKNIHRDKISTDHDTNAKFHSSDDIIDHLSDADPDPKKKNLPWIVKQYKKKNIRQEDNGRVHQTIQDFRDHKNKLPHKDINKYHKIHDLEDHIDRVKGTPEEKSKRQVKKEVKHEGADLIHDEPGLKVHHIKTKEAACHYGAGTRWCTAGKRNNVFDEYHKEGPIYISHHGDGSKFQHHFETSQHADERDKMHEPEDLVKKHPKLKNVKEFQHDRHFARDKNKWADDNVDHKDSNVRAEVAKNTKNPAHHDKLVNDEDGFVRAEVARHTKNPAHHDKLVSDENVFVRSEVAKNTKNSAHHDKLVNDEDVYIRAEVAKNTKNPAHHDKLVNDKDVTVRSEVARHTKNPAHHDKLVNDEQWNIRSAVAKNTKNSAHHDRLVNDENEFVRAAVARNTKNPTHHDKLVNDKNASVRSAVASHTKNPAHLKKLVGDTHDTIANIARYRLKSL